MRLLDIDARAAVDLEEVGWAYRVARGIQVAHRVGLFEALLPGAATAAELAGRCETNHAATERLLILMAACGLVVRGADGSYRLSDEGRASFDPASPLYYGEGLAHAMQSWERWDRLEDELRAGERTSSLGREPGPRDHAVFVWAMHHYAVRGRARWLAGCLDLTGRRTMLDLGGGPGSYSIALCERFGELRSTILDLAQTQPIAETNIARFGLSERIGFVAGDWNQPDYGGPYDVALLSNVLHGEGKGCEQRLAKAHAALAPGGLLVVQDFLLDNDRSGPLPAAVFNVHVGAYTVGEMLAAVTGAGFTGATLVGRGPHGNGIVTAEK